MTIERKNKLILKIKIRNINKTRHYLENNKLFESFKIKLNYSNTS